MRLRKLGCGIAAALATATGNPVAQADLSGSLPAGVYGVTVAPPTGCDLFASQSSNAADFGSTCGGLGVIGMAPTQPVSAGDLFQWETRAPTGIAIIGASVGTQMISGVNDGQSGWSGGSFYAGGSRTWHTGDGSESDGLFNSPYWGFQLFCASKSCYVFNVAIYVRTISLLAQDESIPQVSPAGPANNLYLQGSSQYSSPHYVWNAPGQRWPIGAAASGSPSGICDLETIAGATDKVDLTHTVPEGNNYVQCPVSASGDVADAIDTRTHVPTHGDFPLTLVAESASGETSQPSETIWVDNDPVGVSLTSPDDPNPTVWVDHAVTVHAAASAGPSGIAGMVCAVDAGSSQSPGAAGNVAVNGDGVHTVTCTAHNNAVDPNGAHNQGSKSLQLHIDEAPPSISFSPQDPSAPAHLVASIGDAESGVAAASTAVSMAPAGSASFTPLPSTFDGSHVITDIPDAGLHGPYVLRASACDNVGNCASSDETLQLPLRLPVQSIVGYHKVVAPTRIVRERVRIGRRVLHVRLVIRRGHPCAERRIRVAHRRWREVAACRAIQIRTITSKRIAFGKKVQVQGLLITPQGTPIGGVPLLIQTAPANGLNEFSPVATVTTDGTGSWQATLPPGPSRIVEAVYSGSATLLPAVGDASVTVPAKISLSISPHRLPWSGTIHIRGRLVGGYIPADGVALRLLVRYPGSPAASVLSAIRTDARGAFATALSYHRGRGVSTMPFWVATTASESDYPFAPAASRRIAVTFG